MKTEAGSFAGRMGPTTRSGPTGAGSGGGCAKTGSDSTAAHAAASQPRPHPPLLGLNARCTLAFSVCCADWNYLEVSIAGYLRLLVKALDVGGGRARCGMRLAAYAGSRYSDSERT